MSAGHAGRGLCSSAGHTHLRYIAAGMDTGRLCVWDIDDVLHDLSTAGDMHGPRKDSYASSSKESKEKAAASSAAGAVAISTLHPHVEGHLLDR